MASSKEVPKIVIIDPNKEMDIDDMVKSLVKIHISSHDKEVKIVTNKKSLEECLKNISKFCPICKSDFGKENFYLVDINDGCGSETYIECICENYREVIKKYDG